MLGTIPNAILQSQTVCSTHSFTHSVETWMKHWTWDCGQSKTLSRSELVRERDKNTMRDQVTRAENKDVFSRRGRGTAGSRDTA